MANIERSEGFLWRTVAHTATLSVRHKLFATVYSGNNMGWKTLSEIDVGAEVFEIHRLGISSLCKTLKMMKSGRK